MDRESGLPRLLPDTDAVRSYAFLAKGVVRAVYPEEWRVNIEPDTGGMIHKAVVVGDILPPVHQDTAQPSHVIFQHAYGNLADVYCWPLTYRRFLDPGNTLKEEQGKNARSQEDRGDTEDSESKSDEPPQHFYHTHTHIKRAGDLTISVTADNTWVIKSESGDLIRLNQNRREIDLLAPTARIGTMEATRIEYSRGEHVHIVMPIILLGSPDSNQQLILGNIFMDDRFNPNVMVFNQHIHTGVVPGGGVSGPPVKPQQEMSTDQLSDISKTQKSF